MNQLRHRISYYDLHGGLEVKIRSPKPAQMVRLALVEIVLFSFFALIILNVFPEEPSKSPFGFFFMVIMTTIVVGHFLHSLALWFWWLFGAEIILVKPNSIKCYLCLARFRLWRKFSAKGIIQIYFTGQFANDPIDEWGMYENGYGFTIQRRQYALALKHGGKTYRFGSHLSEREAEGIRSRLKPFLG